MSWLSLILLVIQYGPAVYKLVKEIIDLIKHRDNGFQEREAFGVELSRALDELKASRDLRPLEALRERLRKRHGQSAGG